MKIMVKDENKSLLDFAGEWKGEKEETEEILEELMEERHKAKRTSNHEKSKTF